LGGGILEKRKVHPHDKRKGRENQRD